MRRATPALLALLLAGCVGAGGDCPTQAAPVCFDDGSCVPGSDCKTTYEGIRAMAWFDGALDVDRAIEALRLGGHPHAERGADGQSVVAKNLTLAPDGASGWRFVREVGDGPLEGQSGLGVLREGKARWGLVEGGFRNELLRFEGAYEQWNTRVGWAPIVSRA